MSHSGDANKHNPRAKNAFADVPKNEKGGILVTEEDIMLAFQFLDKYKQGKITPKLLFERMQCFLPHLTKDELNFIMGDEKVITLQYLTDLLLDNTITHFDPVAETFKAYDPEETGYIDGKVLQEIFQRLGLPELTDEDFQILQEVATENWYAAKKTIPHNNNNNATTTTSSSHHHTSEDESSHSHSHPVPHHPVKKINLAMFRQLFAITSIRKPTVHELGRSNGEDY